MSVLVTSGSAQQPQPSPSLPSTPTEEDLGGASVWKDANDEYDARQNGFNKLNGTPEGLGKGKGKITTPELVLEDVDEDTSHDNDETPTSNNFSSGIYPPKKDEEEESRRVQENLRLWEEKEKQRRKVARESAAMSTPASVIGDVSRRASLLWSSSNAPTLSSSTARSKNNSSSVNSTTNDTHFHTALPRTSEDALSLRELTSSPVFSPSPSPNISKPPSPTTASLSAENPFDPPDSATPLRTFSTRDPTGEGSVVMRPSSPPLISSSASSGSIYNSKPPLMPDTQPEGSPFVDAPEKPERPTLQTNSSSSRPQQRQLVPPPEPLGLPSPRTPPPRTSMNLRPPPPHTGGRGQEEEEPERRWWTDWLCGCREGGDHQAGRTNPFE